LKGDSFFTNIFQEGVQAMDLIFVRHGECHTSSADALLTSKGERQALQVGQRLAKIPIAALLSSPLLRALGTASVIAQQRGNCPVEVWSELREGFDGSHRCCGRRELLQRSPLALLPADIEDDGWDYGGDTREAMFERCHLILDKLQERFKPNDTVVIVTHGGMLTYLFHVLFQISDLAPVWFRVGHAGINHIRLLSQDKQSAYPPLYPHIALLVLSINDRSHLSRSLDASEKQ
jgi:broad specificity phosphatase PhoE